MFGRDYGLLILLVCLLLAGCPSGNSPPAAPTPPPANSSTSGTATDPGDSDAEAPATDGDGELTGTVSFAGEVPEPRKIQVTKDEDICGVAAGEVQDVLVDEDGGLADVVVEIFGVKGDAEWDEPEGGYVIHQKDCRFEPHVMVAYDGAKLTIFNDDPVEHNINTGEWNIVQAPSKEPIDQSISYGGQAYVRVTCNIHNWMEAWVYVARSPYYAKTGADGGFAITGVPPGDYRVIATHPTLGNERLRVSIEAGESVAQDVSFE